MTRDVMAQKVRENLDDEGVTYYSVTDINVAIQDGYDEVAVYTECIEKLVAIPIAADTTYYDLSTLIPDYYKIISIYHTDANFYLNPIVDRDITSYRADWEIVNLQEREFMILGPKYVGINGRNSHPVGNFEIRYKAQAPIMDSTDIPRILTDYQNILIEYATADLLEQNEEFTKAKGYWEVYNLELEDYRYKIQLLSKADRLFVRAEQIYW